MRLPLLATLIVAAAVAIMIGLGIWQLQRAEWKEQLIAELSAKDSQRSASVTCTAEGKPEVRAGRSRAGDTGYRYLLPCRSADGAAVMLDLGWSKRPNALAALSRTGSFTGVYEAGPQGSRRILILENPVPPLEASGLPSPADIPNNHIVYAVQWFFFAAVAVLIYVLALRRRLGPGELPRPR